LIPLTLAPITLSSCLLMGPVTYDASAPASTYRLARMMASWGGWMAMRRGVSHHISVGGGRRWSGGGGAMLRRRHRTAHSTPRHSTQHTTSPRGRTWRLRRARRCAPPGKSRHPRWPHAQQTPAAAMQHGVQKGPHSSKVWRSWQPRLRLRSQTTCPDKHTHTYTVLMH
jgi:hypothetical protein